MEESNQKFVVGGAIAAVLVIAGVIYFWPKSESEQPIAKTQTPVAAPQPEADYPVPAPKADAPQLPALEGSDPLFADLVGSVFGNDTVQTWIVKNDVARHVVVTVDNLPRKKVAERLKPIKPIPGKFAVSGPEGAQTIAAENAARYNNAVRALETVDTQALAAAYFKVYPLLQQAYVELGYPNGYFNNRVIEVIDHLLATPEVPGPIQLTQPNVMFEFADPRLEALSAGQKTMLRMGPEHAAVVKKKLRELRSAFTAKAPG